MKSEKTKERLLLASLTAVFIAVIIISIHLDNNRRGEIYILLNNPTFVGKVVDTESVSIRSGVFSTFIRQEHRLHIIGEYIDNNEKVKVDRAFIVLGYLYDRFGIGDLIYILTH